MIEWANDYEKLPYKLTYKYDEHGNMIEEDWYNTNGELSGKWTYKYKYDDKGNMIEQTRYAIQDGKEILQSQTVYEYTFHEESKNQNEKIKAADKK